MTNLSSNINNAACHASGYIDTAAHWTLNNASIAYTNSINYLTEQSHKLPLLNMILPQQNETSASAFSRGAKIGVCVMLTGTAAAFAIKVVTTVVSTVVTKAVVGFAVGGILGLTQHYLAKTSAQGPASAALVDAMQDNGSQPPLESREINVNDAVTS